MAEWKVSGSESEGDGAKESTLDFGGFQIPPPRIVELLQSVERHKTLKLDCLNDTRRKERRRAKRRRRNKVHSPGTVRSLEEVSETASEVRSTTSTTDCRDARRCVPHPLWCFGLNGYHSNHCDGYGKRSLFPSSVTESRWISATVTGSLAV